MFSQPELALDEDLLQRIRAKTSNRLTVKGYIKALRYIFAKSSEKCLARRFREKMVRQSLEEEMVGLVKGKVFALDEFRAEGYGDWGQDATAAVRAAQRAKVPILFCDLPQEWTLSKVIPIYNEEWVASKTERLKFLENLELASRFLEAEEAMIREAVMSGHGGDLPSLDYGVGLCRPATGFAEAATRRLWLEERDPVMARAVTNALEGRARVLEGNAVQPPQRAVQRAVLQVGCCHVEGIVNALVQNHDFEVVPEPQGGWPDVTDIVEVFVPAPPPGPPPPSPPKEDVWAGTVSGTQGENPTESLRTFELPRLALEASPLQFGDWLSVIDSLMGDLSYSSKEWWDLIRQSVDQCYAEWLNTGPLERFRLKPQPDDRIRLWPRTERRALSMLLGAVPDTIKEEIISSRKLTTDQVLYRLYVTYQPGGASERTKLLQCITDAKCGTALGDVVEWIRLWRRYVQRATELQIVLPDGLVLLGALSKCTDHLSGKSPQVAYRLNLIRQHLAVDQLPTAEKILSYAEHLQAEAEELLIASNARNPSTIRAAALGIAAPLGINQGDSEPKPPSPPKKGTCKYWMGEKGCNRGDQCKFQHAPLDPQSNRCFNCSAVGHSRRDCPLKLQGADPKGDPKRKVAKSAKSQGKGKEGKGGKGSGETEKNPPNGPNSEFSSGNGQPDKGSETEQSTTDKVDGLLTEATSLLKSLSPEVKAIKIKRVGNPEGATGLLDGGLIDLGFAIRNGAKNCLLESRC
eukprot:symbB.v1.2.023347.t1/scaffold2131.1/size88260/2